MQLRKEAWIKNSGLQRALNPWPRDSGAMLYQLSYEATDAGSGSIVGSYVPLKEVSVNDIWNKSYMNYGNENEEMIVAVNGNLCNCVKKPEKKKKIRTSTGFKPVTSRYRCDALPTELWSHWRWERVNCGFICSSERNEVLNFFQASLRNCTISQRRFTRQCYRLRQKANRAFSLTWPASLLIHWNRRKFLHKKRVQFTQGCLGTPTWPPFPFFWKTNMAVVTSCENAL